MGIISLGVFELTKSSAQVNEKNTGANFGWVSSVLDPTSSESDYQTALLPNNGRHSTAQAVRLTTLFTAATQIDRFGLCSTRFLFTFIDCRNFFCAMIMTAPYDPLRLPDKAC